MRFIKSLSIFILLTLLCSNLAGMAQPVSAAVLKAYVDNSSIQIQLDNNSVIGFGWTPPPGPKIIVTIDDPAIPGSPDYTAVATWEENYYYAVRPGDSFTLKPGQTVTMTNGSITRKILIVYLAITKVDPSTDTVSGRAAPFAFVGVQVEPFSSDGRSTQANKDGLWSVDFSVPGIISSEQQTYDILNGTAGQAFIYEHGDGVQVSWLACSLEVRPDDNQVEGIGWAFGTNITLKIDDPHTEVDPDFVSNQGVSNFVSGLPNRTVVDFRLGATYVIQPGDEVSLTTGIITRTTIVTSLAIQGVSVYTDTVSGIADPYSHVDVSACNSASCTYRHVDAGKGGGWTADFGIRGDETDEQTTFDVVYGSQVDAVQTDDDGDKTMVGQKVINTRIVVRPSIDLVDGWEWTVGETVTLRINDQFIQSAKVGVASWDASQSNVQFNLAGIYGIQAGDKVSLTNGLITKDTIVTDLEFTAFDVTADTVSGKAQPGSSVDVWTYDGKTDFNRHVTADGNGDWKADFSTRGSAPDENNTFEIEAGSWIDSKQTDVDGDSTESGANANEWEKHQISPIQAPANPVKVNQNAAASITFFTPELEIGDTLLWDWGDGTQTVDVHPDMPTVTAEHQYSQPGIYTLTATIYTSPSRIALTEHFDGLVVISPYDGVVLGNGWFNSPAEASPTNPGLGDRADFLFANAFPVGLVIFKAGSLKFVSTTYDWLVDFGGKLQIKGSGTINGKGSYAFLVNVRDGQASGEGDRLRIKIWNSSSGQVVYDNQPGAGDFADPGTTIGGGFILIQ